MPAPKRGTRRQLSSARRPANGKPLASKSTSRRQPLNDDSDSSDGYSAVDELSDNDDADEEGVTAAEEVHMTRGHRASPRSLPHNGSASKAAGMNDSDDDSSELSDPPELSETDDADDESDGIDDIVDDNEEDGEEDEDDDNLASQDENELAVASPSTWDGIESTGASEEISMADDEEEHTQRRVRFADVHSDEVSSESTDTDDPELSMMFPDLMARDALAPSLLRAIEREHDVFDDDDDDDSIMELQMGLGRLRDDTLFANQVAIQYQTARRGSSQASSPIPNSANGFHHGALRNPNAYLLNLTGQSSTPCLEAESDEESHSSDDESTDLESPVEALKAINGNAGPRPRQGVHIVGDLDDEETDEDDNVPPTKAGLRLRTLNLCKKRTDSKPTMVWDAASKRIVVFYPEDVMRHPLHPDQYQIIKTPADLSPIAPSADLSCGGGPSQALFAELFPAMTPDDVLVSYFAASHGSVVPSTPSDFSNDDIGLSEEEKALLDAFLTESDSDDGEKAPEPQDCEEQTLAPPSTPVAPPLEKPDTPGHTLGHLFEDSNVAGSFRLHQSRHRLMSSGAHTNDSLLLASPHEDSTIRGIRHERLFQANDPITPPRRRSSVAAPRPDILAAAAAANASVNASGKRKASDGHGETSHLGHKRQRSSIPNMAGLQIQGSPIQVGAANGGGRWFG